MGCLTPASPSLLLLLLLLRQHGKRLDGRRRLACYHDLRSRLCCYRWHIKAERLEPPRQLLLVICYLVLAQRCSSLDIFLRQPRILRASRGVAPPLPKLTADQIWYQVERKRRRVGVRDEEGLIVSAGSEQGVGEEVGRGPEKDDDEQQHQTLHIGLASSLRFWVNRCRRAGCRRGEGVDHAELSSASAGRK